jgi:hypothetical protein
METETPGLRRLGGESSDAPHREPCSGQIVTPRITYNSGRWCWGQVCITAGMTVLAPTPRLCRRCGHNVTPTSDRGDRCIEHLNGGIVRYENHLVSSLPGELDNQRLVITRGKLDADK